MMASGNVSDRDLRKLIRGRKVTFAGNVSLKIYGRLQCASGKKMKRRNRIFFYSEDEAVGLGFRPCGHCLRNQYVAWKTKTRYLAEALNPSATMRTKSFPLMNPFPHSAS